MRGHWAPGGHALFTTLVIHRRCFRTSAIDEFEKAAIDAGCTECGCRSRSKYEYNDGIGIRLEGRSDGLAPTVSLRPSISCEAESELGGRAERQDPATDTLAGRRREKRGTDVTCSIGGGVAPARTPDQNRAY